MTHEDSTADTTPSRVVLTEPPIAGNELDTLLGSLERQRRTLAWKCADLDAAQMATTIGASTMTIGGLLRHLARCEDSSFAWKLHDREPMDAGDPAGWDRDWQWTAADDADDSWRQWNGRDNWLPKPSPMAASTARRGITSTVGEHRACAASWST